MINRINNGEQLGTSDKRSGLSLKEGCDLNSVRKPDFRKSRLHRIKISAGDDQGQMIRFYTDRELSVGSQYT